MHRGVQVLRVPTDQGPIGLTVSIGVSHSTCNQGCDGEQLLRAADDALYAAKHGGRNRIEMAPGMHARRARRASGTRAQH